MTEKTLTAAQIEQHKRMVEIGMTAMVQQFMRMTGHIVYSMRIDQDAKEEGVVSITTIPKP